MFDQSYGLRFDIYERIQLSEDVAGIAELEEVELLPHIVVINREDQATLSGHLLLTGLYRGEGEEDSNQRLEHYIPVEITVPLNRVTSLDEIGVEIENFDVDLLSKRSLNITGVLSLRGVESPRNDNSPWNAEDFTVVHAPDWQTFQDSSSQLPDENLTYAGQLERQSLDLSQTDDVLNTTDVQTDQEVLARQKSYPIVAGDTVSNSLESDSAKGNTNLNGIIQESQQLEAFNEKAELKIGLGSKKENLIASQDNVGLSSILTSSRSRSLRNLEQQVQEQQLLAREANQDNDAKEDVEWKSLFLGGTSEKTPFSKVRLCIVQKQETIDLIADRYQLSSRELLLFNRLSEQTIEEGQILYIP